MDRRRRERQRGGQEGTKHPGRRNYSGKERKIRERPSSISLAIPAFCRQAAQDASGCCPGAECDRGIWFLLPVAGRAKLGCLNRDYTISLSSVPLAASLSGLGSVVGPPDSQPLGRPVENQGFMPTTSEQARWHRAAQACMR